MGYGFSVNFSCSDKLATVWLCVGETDNRVKISGTTQLERQPAVLDALNNIGKWGGKVPVWLEAERFGSASLKSQVLQYTSHLQPYGGRLQISGFKRHQPAFTYPGNGEGRLLSEPIKGLRYFIYKGKLETLPNNRGFDCTSFPMVIFGVKSLPLPGYGKQLCEQLTHSKCGLEGLTRGQLEDYLRLDSIPKGIYVFFSSKHVLLHNSDINMIYEFNAPGGLFGLTGFKETPGYLRQMSTPDLWWVRKLDEKYRPCFA